MWSGCVRRDFGKALLRYLCTKARGTSLHVAQASTLTLKCVCISGKPDSLPAPSYFSVYVWRRRMRICDTDPKHEPVVTFYRRRPALWQPAPGAPGLCSRTLPYEGDAFDGEMSSTCPHRHFMSVKSHF